MLNTLKEGIERYGASFFHVLEAFSPSLDGGATLHKNPSYPISIMKQIIAHFTDDDLYKFTMCCAVIDNFPRARVRYLLHGSGWHPISQRFSRTSSWKQVAMLETLVITEEEIDFMKRSCPYIPHWFYNYLKGYRFNRQWVTAHQDEQGHLYVDFEGSWAETILLEVKVLAIISELYYQVTDQTSKLDYEAYYRKSYRKAERLLEAGCIFSDFGTRRRASFQSGRNGGPGLERLQHQRSMEGEIRRNQQRIPGDEVQSDAGGDDGP